jgi:histidine triad (HIT) family protein
MNCIFCKIIEGSIPAAILFEDDSVIAFLDIAPFEKGHFLVLPKHHAVLLTDLPEDLLTHTMLIAKKLAANLLKALPCDGFNMLQNNGTCASQTIPHVHIHIIPRFNGKPMNWVTSSYVSPEELKEMQARLRFN